MRWIDYREKLGIGFDDKRKFQALKNNSLTYMSYLCENFDEFNYLSFYLYFITVCEYASVASINDVRKSFDYTNSTKELISKIVAFSNSVCKYQISTESKKAIKNFLPSVLEGLDIQFEIVKDKDGIFYFPKGAQELDKALVSEPLEWLSDYPKSRTAWIVALKGYSNATDETASQTADNFRKALETFFKEYFGSKKSLENLKSEYGKKLEDYGIPPEIRNNFCTLLQAYTDYINEYAKHNDKTSKLVLEYIMYQTGNIMRLLISLKL